MRHFQLARRAGVPVAAAVVVTAALGALGATPALADATVSPSTAPQGSGQNLVLKFTNDGPKPVHTIKLTFRDDTPLAEAYPLSVDKWAPRIGMRTLASPLPTLHGGTPTTETAAWIEWLAMPGQDLAPGATAELGVAVGPLPTLSSIQLDVATTYADGKPGPAVPPATLTLTPDTTGGQAQAGHGHGGAAAAPEAGAGDEQLFQQAVAQADRGSSVWSYAGWVVAALALAAGAVMMLRNRHRAEDDEPDEEEITDEPAAEDKEPVAAGTGASKWAFRG